MTSVKSILQWAEGEILSLGPPLPGTVALVARSEVPGGTFVFGTRVIARGQALATHRFLACDVVYVIQKGQGRATVEGQSLTVVSGMTISVPRQHWHALQNTGTGELHVVWLAVPAGIEGLFREMARQRSSPMALQELGARYGVEFLTAQEPPALAPPRGGSRRRRRGGRGRGRADTAAAAAPVPASMESAPVVAPSPTPPTGAPVVAPTAAATSPVGRRRHRRHRRPHRSSQGSAPAAPTRPSGAPTPAPAAREASRAPTAPSPKSRGSPGRRRSKVKEVYMGGRWIRVTGEGPVIAPG